MLRESSVQLGKQGITENFIITLRGHFENHRIVKISVLRSARKNKTDVENYAKKIVQELGDKYSYRIIGFTIILRRWKNSRTRESL